MEGTPRSWAEETGHRWGRGEDRGSGRWGWRGKNVSGGGILGAEGERREWAGSDGSREQSSNREREWYDPPKGQGTESHWGGRGSLRKKCWVAWYRDESREKGPASNMVPMGLASRHLCPCVVSSLLPCGTSWWVWLLSYEGNGVCLPC